MIGTVRNTAHAMRRGCGALVGLSMALLVVVTGQADGPTLAQAVRENQAEAVAQGVSFTFVQPMLRLEVTNRTNQPLALRVERGTILTPGDRVYSEVMVAQDAEITVPGGGRVTANLQAFTLEYARAFPAGAVRYNVAPDRQPTAAVAATLDRIAAERAQEHYPAQLAVWMAQEDFADFATLEKSLRVPLTNHRDETVRLAGKADPVCPGDPRCPPTVGGAALTVGTMALVLVLVTVFGIVIFRGRPPTLPAPVPSPLPSAPPPVEPERCPACLQPIAADGTCGCPGRTKERTAERPRPAGSGQRQPSPKEPPTNIPGAAADAGPAAPPPPPPPARDHTATEADQRHTDMDGAGDTQSGPVLTVLAGASSRIVPLPDHPFLLSRDAVEVREVAHGTISMPHAAIDLRSSLPHIVDLNSLNGTWLRGTRVQGRAPLPRNAELRLGGTNAPTWTFEAGPPPRLVCDDQVIDLTTHGVTVISRQALPVVTVRDSELDSPHLYLWQDLEGYHLRDLNGRGGSFVDGQPTAGRDIRLPVGAELRLGKTLLQYAGPGIHGAGGAPRQAPTPGAKVNPSQRRSTAAEDAMNDRTEPFGHYRLTGERPKRGGQGAVYHGVGAKGEDVAIKVPYPDQFRKGTLTRDLFLNEARRQRTLEHPNIIPVLEVGEHDEITECPYIVMQWIDGLPASDLLERMTMPDAIEIMRQTALALRHAHQQGVVHRDAKLRNILVDRRGNCYLGDFGISTQNELASGDLLTAAGTDPYMPPEAFRQRQPTPQGDIYTLGIDCYQLLSGHLPFRGSREELREAHMFDEPPPLPAAIPEDLQQIVVTCLEKMPQGRYPSVDALLEALVKAGYLEAPNRPVPGANLAVLVRQTLGLREYRRGLLVLCQYNPDEVRADALAFPTTEQLWMDRGLAQEIQRHAGRDVATEAMKQAPIPSGTAVATTGGTLPVAFLFHAAIRGIGADDFTTSERVQHAVRACLELARKRWVRRVAFFPFGLEEGLRGGLTATEVAQAMLKTLAAEGTPADFDELAISLRDDESFTVFERVAQQLPG